MTIVVIEHIPKPLKDNRPKIALTVFLLMLAVPVALSFQFGYQSAQAERAISGLGVNATQYQDPSQQDAVAANHGGRYPDHEYRQRQDRASTASDAIDHVVSMISRLTRG